MESKCEDRIVALQDAIDSICNATVNNGNVQRLSELNVTASECSSMKVLPRIDLPNFDESGEWRPFLFPIRIRC